MNQLFNLPGQKTKKLQKGMNVILSFPDWHRLAKYDGKTGTIIEIACAWNPYPVVEFKNKHRLAVEPKHILEITQSELF